MERHIDIEIKELKDRLISMAGFVEKAIENAAEAMEKRDAARIREVYEIEKTVNQNHLEVDNACVKLLALQQPLAADLRLIVAVIKMNTDLERMGDQAVNIAHTLELLLAQPEFRPSKDLIEMFAQCKFMVREGLDAFVRQSTGLARDVLIRDDSVDALKSKIFKESVELMKTDSTRIDPALSVILIARNLERIGDHATNIAEDVIFATTGEDVRHHTATSTIRDALSHSK